MAHNTFFLSFLVTLVVVMHGLYAVQYVVTNNAWRTPGGVCFKNKIGFEYSKRTMKTATDFVWNLFQHNNIADRKNVATVRLFVNVMDGIASTFNGDIHVSAQYNNGYSRNVKTEITGVVTARFLDYCNSLRNGFVAELNKKLRNGYSANFLVELLGKNVDYQSEDGNEHKEATRAEHTRALEPDQNKTTA